MERLFSNLRLYDGIRYFGDRVFDVRTENGRIVAVAESPRRAGTEPELVSPAWIDVHSHSDVAALATPECVSRTSGGIGVEVVGNCGLSAFPITECNRAHLERLYARYRQPLDWCDYPGYLDALKKARVAPHIESLVGHNTLRGAVMGYERRQADEGDLAAMRRFLERELEAGALGLSTGLLYVPGRFATESELVSLLRLVARYNGIYTTHLRSEGDELLEAVDEAVRLCRNAGLSKLHISHLKTSGERNWKKLDDVFERLAAAEKSGLSITFDRYAYLHSMTQLSVAAGARYIDLSDAAIEALLRQPGERENMIKELRKRPESYWAETLLVDTRVKEFGDCRGRSLAEIASRRGVGAPELVEFLLEADSVNTTAAFAVMCRENMERITADARCLCGSDESARPLDASLGLSHIRNFGNSARFFRRLESAVGLPAAVRRMTRDAAVRFGLKGYGSLEPGCAAVFTVFDPNRIADRAEFGAPHTPSVGVRLMREND